MIARLEAEGYISIRMLPNGKMAGLMQFMFTLGLVVGLDEHGHEYRYCYEHMLDAAKDLATCDSEGDPAGAWIKHKGRGIDRLNPKIEHLTRL